MNADPIARLYRWIEYAAFSRTLERSRFACIEESLTAQRVLILGEGDGRFLARFLESNPYAQVDVVDGSARMIAMARKRVAGAMQSRVEFFHRDVLTAELPNDTYDVIVTHFFLDCLSEADAGRLICDLRKRLKAGGMWLVAEFNEPPSGLERLHARIWLAVMYRFFRWTTGLRTSRLPPYCQLLREAGLDLEEERRFRFGLIVSQRWRRRHPL